LRLVPWPVVVTHLTAAVGAAAGMSSKRIAGQMVVLHALRDLPPPRPSCITAAQCCKQVGRQLVVVVVLAGARDSPRPACFTPGLVPTLARPSAPGSPCCCPSCHCAVLSLALRQVTSFLTLLSHFDVAEIDWSIERGDGRVWLCRDVGAGKPGARGGSLHPAPDATFPLP